jgi:hypothetical protein
MAYFKDVEDCKQQMATAGPVWNLSASSRKGGYFAGPTKLNDQDAAFLASSLQDAKVLLYVLVLLVVVIITIATAQCISTDMPDLTYLVEFWLPCVAFILVSALSPPLCVFILSSG